MKSIGKIMTAYGDGAQGIVVGMRGAGEAGHSFNVIQRGNSTIFLDFQIKGDAVMSNSMLTGKGYQQFWFIRTK